jgi:membrane-bound lytic murein transglycosylase D
MKRLFTLIFCFLLLQIAKASPSFVSGDIFSKADTIVVPIVNQPAPLNYQSGIYKRRLDSIKKDVPLDYNEYVQSYIDIYMHNRDEMGRVLGLTKYYFPIYEKALRDAGIPDEIKYLSIVESKLDPLAISRVGATGPWQFMATTAKTYGLNMDDYVDDRRDPIQASYAAAAYLKDAYEEFGDWLLAIASYNCGKSNVERAIEKAGSSNFWAIRQYLPNETRGYVPAFIAVTYIMNYYNRHNIVPQPCNYSMTTDTVLVNKYIALSTVSQVLGIDVKQLASLNPAYKKQIINGTGKLPRRLIIPQIDKGKYAALYEALNNNSNIIPAAPHVAYASPVHYDNKTEELPAFHKAKRGETLSDVADNYGIDLQDLKAMNHLHSNKLVAGQRIRLTEAAAELKTESIEKHHNYISYKVKTGDTLSGIVSKFDGASVEKIKSINGLKRERLQPGMTIKIDRG